MACTKYIVSEADFKIYEKIYDVMEVPNPLFSYFLAPISGHLNPENCIAREFLLQFYENLGIHAANKIPMKQQYASELRAGHLNALRRLDALPELANPFSFVRSALCLYMSNPAIVNVLPNLFELFANRYRKLVTAEMAYLKDFSIPFQDRTHNIRVHYQKHDAEILIKTIEKEIGPTASLRVDEFNTPSCRSMYPTVTLFAHSPSPKWTEGPKPLSPKKRPSPEVEEISDEEEEEAAEVTPLFKKLKPLASGVVELPLKFRKYELPRKKEVPAKKEVPTSDDSTNDSEISEEEDIIIS